MACSKVFSSVRGLSSTVYAVLFRLSLLCSLANASFPFSAHNSAAMVGEIILLCCRVEYKDKKRPLVKSEPERPRFMSTISFIYSVLVRPCLTGDACHGLLCAALLFRGKCICVRHWYKFIVVNHKMKRTWSATFSVGKCVSLWILEREVLNVWRKISFLSLHHSVSWWFGEWTFLKKVKIDTC
jgi:hypothetical protein